MNEKLQEILNVVPTLFELVEEKGHVLVLDADNVVQGFAIPKGEKPLMSIGDRFEDPSGAAAEVLRTGKKRRNILPKEVMGVAFEGILVPVKDGSQVVGVIIYSYSIEEKEQMQDITAEFKDSIQEIDESLERMVSGFDNINATLKGMNSRTTEIDESVKAATEIVGLIQSNAKHSNILALNASIEAARSGEFGRGFAVVASEMGKMSNASGSSAKEIDAALASVVEKMSDITQSIVETNQVADAYLEDIRSMKEILDKTLVLAEELQKKI